MSRSRIGIAVVILATLLSGMAEARVRLGVGLLGAPLGVARFAATRLFAIGGLHRGYSTARRGHMRTALLRSQDINTPMNSGRLLGNPAAREQIVAVAAMAGWHGGRTASGWWRHGDGGYGWVGPLFWPFAYYDIYDYALWGDGMGFWGYGYRDIYAAIFTPYDEDQLMRYTAPARHRRPGRVPSLAQICGDDFSELSRLPVEQIRQAIVSNEEERAALDELANASSEAAQTVSAACPKEASLTASARLAVMQQRLEAMKAGIARVRTPFEKFWEMLDDGQKKQLEEFAGQRAPFAPKVPAAQSCTPPDALPWPAKEIEARLHLNDDQREEVGVLRRMSVLAGNTLNFNCQPDENLSPPDRLAMADTRLDAMLDAIKQIRPALDDFIGTLSDEQKAQFETIGAKRTS